MKDGLPDDGIEWVMQDHLGFMWFASRIGMIKYDGYEYTVYKSSGKDSVGSPRDRIRVLYEDSRGDIWAGADGFLNRYIRSRDTIISYKSNDSDAVSLKGKGVYAILEDSDGNMWFGNFGGWISFVDGDQLKFKNYRLEFKQIKETEHDETYIVFNLLEDRDKNIWACTRNGLLKISGNKIKVIQAVPGKKYDRKNTFFSMVQDSNGQFWIGTYGNGIANFNDSTGQFKFYAFKDSEYVRYGSNNILSLLLDSKGSLWAGTQGADRGGLLKFDLSQKTYVQFKENTKIPNSLMEGAYFHNLFEDNSGTIWIPAFQGGVTRIDPSLNQIEQFYYGTKNYNGIDNQKIKCFYEAKNGTIWVGTDSGLLKYNSDKRNFRKVAELTAERVCGKKFNIKQIVEDATGNLWLSGGWGGILWKFNPNNNKLNCYTHQQNSTEGFSNPYISGIAADNEGTIWVSTYGGGLNKYDPNSKQFKRYFVAGRPGNKDDHEEINQLCLDTSGAVWVASYDRTLNYLINLLKHLQGYCSKIFHADLTQPE